MIYLTSIIYGLAAVAIGHLAYAEGAPPDSKADWLAFFALLAFWPLVVVLGVSTRVFRAVRDAYHDRKNRLRYEEVEIYRLRDESFRFAKQLEAEKANSAHWKEESKKHEAAYLKLKKRKPKLPKDSL